MSAEAQPISPAAFASAILDLPLGNLHAKAAELRNSIAHLRSSNEQLQPFADDGDVDCADAIKENEGVIGRMEERIQLLKAEVERRGMLWVEDPDAEEDKGERIMNGAASGGSDESSGGTANGSSAPDSRDIVAPASRTVPSGGRLTDAELERQMLQRLAEDIDDGVHL